MELLAGGCLAPIRSAVHFARAYYLTQTIFVGATI